jgi:hypothetical protein
MLTGKGNIITNSCLTFIYSFTDILFWILFGVLKQREALIHFLVPKPLSLPHLRIFV